MDNSKQRRLGCGFLVLAAIGFFLAGGVFTAQTPPPLIVNWIAAFFFLGGCELSAIVGFALFLRSFDISWGKVFLSMFLGLLALITFTAVFVALFASVR